MSVSLFSPANFSQTFSSRGEMGGWVEFQVWVILHKIGNTFDNHFPANVCQFNSLYFESKEDDSKYKGFQFTNAL